MKILVLGATGQIGQALVERLSATEHDIAVLVRNVGSHPFPERVQVLNRESFTRETFAEALAGVDHAIYGIGLPEQFTFDDSIFQTVNCDLLRTFLDALKEGGINRLTYLSTYEVFAVANNQIDEAQPVADESEMTPYFQSMIRAYRIVLAFARENGTVLTTIHPAAVYGGRNTGAGITDYMENLASRNWSRLPVINPSSFPVVHVDSLADAIVKSLDKPGSFIVSDTMTSLKDIAQTMRKQAWSYVPLVVPVWLILFGVRFLEAFARLTGTKPFASSVQIAFLTKGWEPHSSKAQAQLNWRPMSLEHGIRKFLIERRDFLQAADIATPARGANRIWLIAWLQRVTAVGLFLYWFAYFTIGIGPQDPPPGYYVFQNSFTYADLILAIMLMKSASLLVGADPGRRILGRGLSLICAGALFFLGGLDISFNFQNGIYENPSLDMLAEVGINVWCLCFGFILAYEFAFDAYQRY